MRHSLSAIFCTFLSSVTLTAAEIGPALERFTPATEAPVSSQEPGLAPASSRGMVFEFTCTQAFAAGDDAPQPLTAFDRRASFHSMDRAEVEVSQDDPEAEGYLMRVFTYTKTGADTAVVVCWQGLVYDDGTQEEGSVLEIRLTFTEGNIGTAQFCVTGQGDAAYGCGIFVFRR